MYLYQNKKIELATTTSEQGLESKVLEGYEVQFEDLNFFE